MKTSWFARLEELLIAFLLAAMTLVTFGQVVARYVFNYSFTWAFELTTWLFAGLIFIGISYGIRIGAHIGVDALINILPKNIAHIVTIFATLLCMVYSVIVFVGSWTYVSRMKMIGIYAQDLPVLQWIPRLVLPIGFALMFFRFAQVLITLLRGQDAALLGDEAADALKYSADDANGNVDNTDTTTRGRNS
ncbi:MAG TPA: TRAP transporter small permease [Burkholderiaceae bacterium]|nr:TRAP transporter small permease [Burkholderiaceae bacterium]